MTDNVSNSESKKSRKLAVAAYLARGVTIRDTARFCELSERQVYRLADDPTVIVAVSDYRRVILRSILGAGISGSEKATAKLAELIDNDDPNISLKASARLLRKYGLVFQNTQSIRVLQQGPLPTF